VIKGSDDEGRGGIGVGRRCVCQLG
jgi:hypothetical protein